MKKIIFTLLFACLSSFVFAESSLQEQGVNLKSDVLQMRSEFNPFYEQVKQEYIQNSKSDPTRAKEILNNGLLGFENRYNNLRVRFEDLKQKNEEAKLNSIYEAGYFLAIVEQYLKDMQRVNNKLNKNT